jgi:hypothetical protein
MLGATTIAPSQCAGPRPLPRTWGLEIPARPVAIPVEGPELRGAPRAGLFRGAGRAAGAEHESSRLRRAGIAAAVEGKTGAASHVRAMRDTPDGKQPHYFTRRDEQPVSIAGCGTNGRTSKAGSGRSPAP